MLASPFQAMHGLASPLTAAYGSAPVGGRPRPSKKTHGDIPLSLFTIVHASHPSYVSLCAREKLRDRPPPPSRPHVQEKKKHKTKTNERFQISLFDIRIVLVVS